MIKSQEPEQPTYTYVGHCLVRGQPICSKEPEAPTACESCNLREHLADAKAEAEHWKCRFYEVQAENLRLLEEIEALSPHSNQSEELAAVFLASTKNFAKPDEVDDEDITSA